MRKVFTLAVLLVLLCCINPEILVAQSVGINTDGSVPDASAILDVKSTGKGLLIPRLTSVQRSAIITPASGLLVFDTNTNSFWYYAAGTWMKLSSGWDLAGNNGTDPATHFLGTTDNTPLMVKVNNQVSGTISSKNTSWGYTSLKSNLVGTDNTALGAGSLSNVTSSNNTATGSNALLHSATGDKNTAIGSYALVTNVTGSSNTASGYFSLFSNSSGNSNTAVGGTALFSNTSGGGNTAIGQNTMGANTTGSFNTVIGNNANVSTGNLVNATAIGYNTTVDASNKVRIGNSNVTVIEGQVPFTTPSDGRFKFNVQENVKGLDFILQLRPVTYQFDVQKFDAQVQGNAVNNKDDKVDKLLQASYNEAMAIRRTGFIAQEVEQAAIRSGYNFSGIIKPQTAQDHYSLSYESFVVPLVKAVQEQDELIKALIKRIEILEKNNNRKK